jgi:DNA-binding MarR family transcriptional regulator
LAKLESEGFVERRRSEEDARKLVVVLTPAGTERAQEYQRESQEFERNALSCLSLEERAALLETLDRLIDHWNDLEPLGGTSSTERKGE